MSKRWLNLTRLEDLAWDDCKCGGLTANEINRGYRCSSCRASDILNEIAIIAHNGLNDILSGDK